MTTARRNQQAQVYAAEAGVPNGQPLASAVATERWVNGLRDEPWWVDHYSMVRYVHVTFVGRSDSVGGFDRKTGVGQLDIAAGDRYEQTVVHELAHVLADARFGSQAHCPWFARTYAELTYWLRGSDVWLKLQAGYDAQGVDYRQEKVK